MPETHPLVARRIHPSAAKMLFDYLRGADVRARHRLEPDRDAVRPAVPPGKNIIHSTNDAGDINKDYRVDARWSAMRGWSSRR